MKKRKPHDSLYRKFRRFFFAAGWRIDRFRARHLSIGRQKWREDKLCIEKIPPYIASEATEYLAAILRDYLRAFASIACSLDGKYVTGEDFEAALARWKGIVNGVADTFDEAADLWREAWEGRNADFLDSHRRKIEEAFCGLARIFQDLNE